MGRNLRPTWKKPSQSGETSSCVTSLSRSFWRTSPPIPTPKIVPTTPTSKTGSSGSSTRSSTSSMISTSTKRKNSLFVSRFFLLYLFLSISRILLLEIRIGFFLLLLIHAFYYLFYFFFSENNEIHFIQLKLEIIRFLKCFLIMLLGS